MTEENKKNKEALDTNMSSAFFVLKTHITQECYKKLLEIFDKESHAFRALDFLHNFHQTNIYSCKKMEEAKKENPRKKDPKDPYVDGFYLASSRKRDTLDDYPQIFDKLFENNMLIEVFKQVGRKAQTVKINPNYLAKEINNIEVPESYTKYRNLTKKKDSNRFNRTYGDIKIGFAISEENAISELIKAGKSEDTIQTQLNYYREIVNNGYLDGKQKRNSRVSSIFHNISKKITNWTTINGQLTINLDQHATYYSILPRLLTDNLYMVEENEELNELVVCEIEKMQEMFFNTDDIYQTICDIVGFTREEIKEKMNAFICETNTPDYILPIYNFFKQEYPHCLNLLEKMRKLTDNYVSTSCMKIESNIFVRASKILKEQNILTFTKHDQIFCIPTDLDTVQEVLMKCFDIEKVVYKIKIVNPILENIELFSPNVENASLSSELHHLRTEKPEHEREEEREEDYSSGNCSLSGAKGRDREISIKDYRNGFRISVKKKYYYSEKNETKEQFYERLMNMEEISNDVKKLIKFEETNKEKDMNEFIENLIPNNHKEEKILTSEIKDVKIEKVEEEPKAVEALAETIKRKPRVVWSLGNEMPKPKNKEVVSEIVVEENIVEFPEVVNVEDMDDFTRHILNSKEFLKRSKEWKKMGVVK